MRALPHPSLLPAALILQRAGDRFPETAFRRSWTGPVRAGCTCKRTSVPTVTRPGRTHFNMSLAALVQAVVTSRMYFA